MRLKCRPRVPSHSASSKVHLSPPGGPTAAANTDGKRRAKRLLYRLGCTLRTFQRGLDIESFTVVYPCSFVVKRHASLAASTEPVGASAPAACAIAVWLGPLGIRGTYRAQIEGPSRRRRVPSAAAGLRRGGPSMATRFQGGPRCPGASQRVIIAGQDGGGSCEARRAARCAIAPPPKNPR